MTKGLLGKLDKCGSYAEGASTRAFSGNIDIVALLTLEVMKIVVLETTQQDVLRTYQ